MVTSRQDQASLRRRNFVDAARQLFAERGYHATSIRDVHRQADAADGLAYHYFPSKLDLLHAVLEDGFASMRAGRLGDDVGADESLPAALRRTAERLWGRWLEHEDLIRILLREHRELESSEDYSLPAAFHRSAQGLVDLLAQRSSELRPIDAQIGARQFIDALLGHFVFAVIVGGAHVEPIGADRYIDATVDLFWHGWRRTTQEVEPA